MAENTESKAMDAFMTQFVNNIDIVTIKRSYSSRSYDDKTAMRFTLATSANLCHIKAKAHLQAAGIILTVSNSTATVCNVSVKSVKDEDDILTHIFCCASIAAPITPASSSISEIRTFT